MEEVNKGKNEDLSSRCIDMNFSTFSRPILDELSCSINLKEFHSLNNEEVEANLLSECVNVEDIKTISKSGANSEVQIFKNQNQKSYYDDLFFKDEITDIKMEFSCETEKLIEQNFKDEYFLDDIGGEEKVDNLLQIEVYSTANDLHSVKEDNRNFSPEIIDEFDVISKVNRNQKENDNLLNLDEDISLFDSKLDENSQLLNIMSDHNYTSQETIQPQIQVETLRQNLIKHILGKISYNKSNTDNILENDTSIEIQSFVKDLIINLNKFSLDQKTRIECVKNNKIKDNYNIKETDAFLENVIESVIAEDAADETFYFNSDRCETRNSTNKINEIDKIEEIHSNMKVIEKITDNKNVELSPTDIESETMQNLRSFTLPENCSEPMEHSNLDEIFDNFSNHSNVQMCKKNGEMTNEYNEILEKIMAFAKALYDDCLFFKSASTNIENKLQKYLSKKFRQFQLLLDDKEIYKSIHNNKLFKRKLKKMNLRNKRVLLESSNSSDSSESSDIEKFHKSFVTKLPYVHSQRSTDITSDSNNMSCSNENFSNVYDDGVPLFKYIQSEIFETDIFSTQSSMSPKLQTIFDSCKNNNFENACERYSNAISEKNLPIKDLKHSFLQCESDKENLNGKTTSLSIIPYKSKKKSKSFNDEQMDKEIDRLINLSGLKKRFIHNNTSKSSDVKMKSQNQLKKHSFIEDGRDDTHKYGASDASIYESDEDIMTEKQYLARYNENLKQQLLNVSSSEPESTDENDNELNELSSSENSEDLNDVPRIEKFLKNYSIDQNDNDNDTENNESNENQNTNISKGDLLSNDKNNVNDKDILVDDKEMNNSDCEVLNDNLLSRKRIKSKTLEKMIADIDRRKNFNKAGEELISLSSENDSTSDVETADVDPIESSLRIIKPMLRPDQLASETRKAQKNEGDRIRRLEKKHTMLIRAIKKNFNTCNSNDLILDYNEETKTFIKVNPDIVKFLKNHQIDGVKFMYDSCYGGIDSLKKNGGSGCILAHCMGLGKTLQLIALLHTVISYEELKTKKVLVLCPKSTVMNWADEIMRWLGPLNTNNLKVFTFSDTSDINEKLSILKEWSLSTQDNAGCLLIGYEAFRTLVFYHSYKNRSNVSASRLENIRDNINRYLLKPGADLVVCDEGHIIKNSKSAISLAVAQIVTPKRIVLTGTPIQNNLKEYYSMVNFIKPLFLGTEKEFANLYANPIKNGQHKDSNKRDIKIMKQRSFVLHKKLSKFVQRKEAELLKSFLPQKFEYVLFIPMSEVQNNLYEYILAAITKREENRGRSLITDYTCLRKIWTHPKVLEDAWKNANNQKYKKDTKHKNQIQHSDDDQPDDIYDSQTGVMSVTNDWWRHLLTDDNLESIMPSNKLRTMFEILRMCAEKGEKCLIFSAFVAVLNVVEHFFRKITNRDPLTLRELNTSVNNIRHTWISGQDYYRLDGKTPKSIRHEMIKRFNSPTNNVARVFLISSKAGGQGINLIGANRVIILDTSWNPSNDQQNIFRIFRLGQKKNCYIYRLLAMGTMEEKVYSRSVTKQAMSFRVVDEQQIDRHYSMAELAELYTLTIPNSAARPLPDFPQDSILASLLLNYPDMVYKYHEHDSLLENKMEQELSEQEKADAWAAYERDLQINSEIRGLPNIDDIHNNLSAARVPNYLSMFPGFEMQSFLNYNNLNHQTATSPYSLPLLSQYNYSTTSQQYVEMLNLYQKYSHTALGFPEIGKPLGENTYSPSAFYSGMNSAQKIIPTSPTTMLSSLQSSNVPSTNPLSALGDLSLFGLSGPKNLTASGQNHTVVSSPSGNIHTNTIANTMLQYKQLENVYQSLYGYPSNEFSSSNTNKSKFPANMNVNSCNTFLNTSTYTRDTNLTKETGLIEQQKIVKPVQKQNTVISQKSDINASHEVFTSIGNVETSNDGTGNLRYPTIVNKVPEATISAQPNEVQPKGLKMRTSSVNISNLKNNVSSENPDTSFANIASASMNMGIVYPNIGNKQTHQTVIPPNAPDSMKNKNEIQIIPTNILGGCSNISKQFNSLLPNISVTAVRSSSPNCKESTTTLNLHNQKDSIVNVNTLGSNVSILSNNKNINNKSSINIKGIQNDNGNGAGINFYNNKNICSEIKKSNSLESVKNISNSATCTNASKKSIAIPTKTKPNRTTQNDFKHITINNMNDKQMGIPNTTAKGIIKSKNPKQQNTSLQTQKNISSSFVHTPVKITKAVISPKISTASISALSSLHENNSKTSIDSNSSGSSTLQIRNRIPGCHGQNVTKETSNINTKNNKNVQPPTGIYMIDTNNKERLETTKSENQATINKIGPKRRQPLDINICDVKRPKKTTSYVNK